jgi:hypothetical protein
MTRDAKLKEGFMADQLGSDDRLEYASGPASEEAAFPRIQLRKIRTRWKVVRSL